MLIGGNILDTKVPSTYVNNFLLQVMALNWLISGGGNSRPRSSSFVMSSEMRAVEKNLRVLWEIDNQPKGSEKMTSDEAGLKIYRENR